VLRWVFESRKNLGGDIMSATGKWAATIKSPMGDPVRSKNYGATSMKVKALLLTVSLCGLSGVALADNSDPKQSVVKENFEASDANGDGALSKDEFIVFIDANADAGIGRAPRIRQFKAYGRVFKQLDVDKNGLVTWDEFVAAKKS
jgi:hypothetical protein